MLQIKELVKVYDQTKVLDVPELEIQKGEVVGVVGNNGAGKTTLFSLVLDLIKATKGKVLSKEQDVSQTEEWKLYTTAFLDEGFLIGFLTSDEYFEFVGKIYGLSPVDVQQFVGQFEAIFNDEILGKKKYIRDLSKGNQKKVGLVGALIGNPELVVWDEPFSNLDPSTQLRVKNLVQEQSKDKTFLISSHNLNYITDVCSRIIILEKGLVVKDVNRSETTIDELYAFFTPA